MAVWMPGAVKKPLKINYTNARRRTTNAVILHVAAGEAVSLHGWFSNPAAKASSHFYVRRDGAIEQYLPIDKISWAGVKSDSRAISVETQGLGHGEWTLAQVEAIIKIIRFCQAEFPSIPTRLMRSSKQSEAGIGWHALGVPASYAQKNRGVSQTGGELWSGAPGKICPGPDRIKQIPGIVAALENGSVGPDLDSRTYYTGMIDGEPGPWTWTAIQRFLTDRNYYNRQIDGDPGPYTWTALQRYLSDLGYFTVSPSGAQDLTTARALQQWLTNTGHYQGEITATWDTDLWEAWQTYLRWAHKETTVYPLSPKTEPKPTPKEEKDFLMALTDNEQREILRLARTGKDDDVKIKTAIQRLEAEVAEIKAELTDIDANTVGGKVWRTNAAMGRAEKARLEAEADENTLKEID